MRCKRVRKKPKNGKNTNFKKIIMGLFRITVKQSNYSNGIRLEKGMTVDVPSRYSNPVTTNGGQEVADAFQRIYGIDIRKNGGLSMTYLEVEKIN